MGMSVLSIALSANAFATRLIRAMSGKRSSAQPSKESISFCRLKFRGRSVTGEVGVDIVGEEARTER